MSLTWTDVLKSVFHCMMLCNRIGLHWSKCFNILKIINCDLTIFSVFSTSYSSSISLRELLTKEGKVLIDLLWLLSTVALTF